MVDAAEIMVSASELRKVAARLARQGTPALVIDGAQVRDRRSFVQQLARALPLDPPLASGRSLDALADSLLGGLVGVQPPALLWDSAWVLKREDEEEFLRLVGVLADAKDLLAEPPPAGINRDLTILVAAEPDRGFG